MDDYRNFAVAIIDSPPTPAESGTTLVVASGQGTRFPAPPFNATVWPVDVLPDPTTAEIVRVTAIAGDMLLVLRTQEATQARTIQPGDLIAATITDKTILDLQAPHGLKHSPGGTDPLQLSAADRLVGTGDTAGPIQEIALGPSLSIVDGVIEVVGGGGGAGGVVQVVRETPSGVINGANVTFLLVNTPVVGSEQVFLNGLLQEARGVDYSIVGSTITFLMAPYAGDRVLVTYGKGS